MELKIGMVGPDGFAHMVALVDKDRLLAEGWKLLPMPQPLSYEDLANRFSYHPASDEMTRAQHDAVRQEALGFAEFLRGMLPEGREMATAITKLEEVMFWANAAIARNPIDKLHGEQHPEA